MERRYRFEIALHHLLSEREPYTSKLDKKRQAYHIHDKNSVLKSLIFISINTVDSLVGGIGFNSLCNMEESQTDLKKSVKIASI